MDFPKKQAQRLMPLYLLEYSEKLFTNHPNPEDPWGGGNYTAGQGITITNNEISVDTNVIATKSDIAQMVTTTQLNDALDDYALKTEIPTDVSQLNNDAGYATETWVQNQGYATSSEIPTNYVTLDTEQTITGLKTIGQTDGTISKVDFSGFTFKLSNKAINHPEADIKIRNGSYDGYQHPIISSTKGLYVNLAKIRLGDDGSNTYGITMPDSSTWEADRVLATTNDIPTKTSELQNDSGFITGVTWNDVTEKPTFATVATSGSYNDLTDKPNLVDPHTIANGDLVFQSTGSWTPDMKWFDDAVITSASSSFVDIITNFEADLILPSEFTFDAVLYAKRMVDGFQISEHEFRYVYALDSGYGQPAYIWFIYNNSLNTITSVTKQLFDAISYSTLTNILSSYVTSSSLSSTLSDYALKSEVPSYSLSTTSTPVLSSAILSKSYETLTFTYSDNTTASFNFLTEDTGMITNEVNVLDSGTLTSN